MEKEITTLYVWEIGSSVVKSVNLHPCILFHLISPMTLHEAKHKSTFSRSDIVVMSKFKLKSRIPLLFYCVKHIILLCQTQPKKCNSRHAMNRHQNADVMVLANAPMRGCRPLWMGGGLEFNNVAIRWKFSTATRNRNHSVAQSSNFRELEQLTDQRYADNEHAMQRSARML
jgi:hypothetical protein